MPAPRSSVVALVAGLLMFGSPAHAAPEPGGRYEGDVLIPQEDANGRQVPSCRGCLELIVANDGQSLEGGYIAFEAPCVLVQEWPSPTVGIDPAGGFTWVVSQTGYGRFAIQGEFTSDGRVAGRLSFSGGPDGGCKVDDVEFRATLRDTPARTQPGRATACGAVPGRSRAVDVVAHERGVGCTRAKTLELAWAHEPACAQAVGRPACTLEAFRCAGVHGGRASPQASVRCVTDEPRRGAVELEMQRGCGYVRAARLNLSAINLSCSAARGVGRRMPEGCGEDVGDRCRSGGYSCRVTALTPDSVMGRCALRADPFRALAFEYVYPL